MRMALSDEELKKFWEMANTLRKNLDAAEYKHIVLGLVFLKHVSDSFEERRTELETKFSDPKSDQYKPNEKARANALDTRDYYTEVNVFWVPEDSRWQIIADNSKQADLALRIDNALYEIERENPKLEGIVERSYANAKLPVADLGAVVDLIGTISFANGRDQASDVLGQVYEYFLGNFASAEGKLGGQFYTTPSIVRTLVEILQPTEGRVYDPACGSGGMFVQSERFVEAHGGKLGQIAIYGQESNPTTRRLCAMNLAIRGIDFDLGKTHGDTFTEDQHKDVRFDYIMMNPPFGINASYPRSQLLDDVRWKKYGIPREKPANYAWMSHAIHHLAPNGRAGIVMARASLTSTHGGDDEIRAAMLRDDIVECIIDLPGQLFFNVPIPSCIWFFNKNKSKWGNDRRGQVLFIDAKSFGTPVSKTQIEFTDADIAKISSIFNSWKDGDYEDVAGLCSSVSIENIEKNNFSLSPSRYLGTVEVESDSDEETEFQWSESLAAMEIELANLEKLDLAVGKSLERIGIEPNVAKIFMRDPDNLLDIANSLFKLWFLDFDPITAVGTTREVSMLNQAIRKFYPSELVDSELGLIPKSWQVLEAQSLFDMSIGRTPPRKEPHWFTEGQAGNSWVSIKDMGNYSLFTGESNEGITDEAVTKFNMHVVPAGSILMSFKLTVGRLAIVSEPVTTNEAIAHFKQKQQSIIPTEFAYLWLRNYDFDLLDSTSSIATATNSGFVKSIKFLVPDENVLSEFIAIVRPLFEQIRNIHKLNQHIGKLRDSGVNIVLMASDQAPER
jgi:type I restriction enzyme M protein